MCCYIEFGFSLGISNDKQPIDIVVVAFDPHASSPSSNTINIDIEIDEPSLKSLFV